MIDILLLGLFILTLVVTLYWFLVRKLSELAKPKEDLALLEWLKTTQQDMKNLQQSINDTMLKSNQHLSSTLQSQTKDIHDRLTKAAEVIGELKREAGAFQEIGKSMQEFQQFLKSPKLRGNIGEQILADLLADAFPKAVYSLQYTFRSGVKADAVLKTSLGLLPIDSKFSMENYQKMVSADEEKDREASRKVFAKDVKGRIDEIAKKYILPEEGTLDFALMYVPSEAVYYEIIRDGKLSDYAQKTRVYPVSPNTLYAFLRVILLSYEGQKIEARAREVFSLLRGVKKDYEKLDGQLGTLGRHLTNAYNNMAGVQSAFTTLGQKIDTAQGLGEGTGSKQHTLEAEV